MLREFSLRQGPRPIRLYKHHPHRPTLMLLQENNQRNDGDPEEHEEEYLPETVWAVALHFARARVDHHLIDLLIEAISCQVDRQEDVFESDVRIACVYAVNPLLVAADVTAHVAVNDARHDLFCFFKACGQLDLITLRFEA